MTLEPQTAAHAEEMFALLSDPKIYRYENEPPPSLEWLRTRFTKLESRRSPDGREKWLNWVIRLETGAAAGYVQATVHEDGRAAIAYVLGSRFWDRGIGRAAVASLIDILTGAWREPLDGGAEARQRALAAAARTPWFFRRNVFRGSG